MRPPCPLLIPCLALLGPNPSAGQDLSSLTDLLFQNVNSVSVHVQRSTFERASPLEPMGKGWGVTGAGAEIYIGLPSSGLWELELALGTTYLRGFRASDPAVVLRGALRSFPTLGFYASRKITGSVQVYGGVNMGITELWNAQVYPADTSAAGFTLRQSASGQTYDFGPSAGLAAKLPGIPSVTAFAEFQYRRRSFGGVEYSGDSVAAAWPRSLNANTYGVAVGLQFSLNAEPEPPASLGLWRLVSVDGDTLPATHRATPTRGGLVDRVEIVGGTLSFGEDGRYALLLRQRTRSVSAATGALSGAGGPSVEPLYEQVGTFDAEGKAPSLTPLGKATPVVRREGDRLVVELRDPGYAHVLTFVKAES